MANADAKRIWKTAPNAGTGSYVIKNDVQLYEGQLVQLDANGYLDHYTEATGLFLGILKSGDSRLGDGVIVGATGDAKPPEGQVDESGVTLMHMAVGSATQASVGDPVYCDDSDTANLTVTATGAAKKIGYVVRFRTASDCDVRLYTPAEYNGDN